jgi:hypothetical protein
MTIIYDKKGAIEALITKFDKDNGVETVYFGGNLEYNSQGAEVSHGRVINGQVTRVTYMNWELGLAKREKRKTQ